MQKKRGRHSGVLWWQISFLKITGNILLKEAPLVYGQNHFWFSEVKNYNVSAEETEPVDQTEQAEAEVETSPEEDEFNTWSGKLEKFFVQLLFPAWSHQENVRSQVLKDKAELEEQQRIHELHKEAERLVIVVAVWTIIHYCSR